MPSWPPAQDALQPGAVQLQKVRFVGAAPGTVFPGLPVSPEPAEQIDQFSGGHAVAVIRPDIVKTRINMIFILFFQNL